VNLVGEVDDSVLRLLAFSGSELGSLGLGGRRRDGGEGSVDSLRSSETSGDSRLLGDTETERNDSGDVVIRSEDLDLYTESFSEKTHSLETFLVVGSTTTNEDANLVELETTLVLLESRDDTLEGSSDVGEVGDTSSDEEQLALRVGSTASHEID
jgi:hypothetical protein